MFASLNDQLLFVLQTEDEDCAAGTTVARCPTPQSHHKVCLGRRKQLQHDPPGELSV